MTYRVAALVGGSLALGTSIVSYTVFRGMMSSMRDPGLPGIFMELFALGPLVASPFVGAALGVSVLAVSRLKRGHHVALGVGTTAGFVLGTAYTIGLTEAAPPPLLIGGTAVAATTTLYLWLQERKQHHHKV